jgi:hypothetical protein
LDRNQVNVDVTTAITKVKDSFPNAQIGLCGIIPRKGTSNNYLKLNETAANVNKFLKMLCIKDPVLEYIDTTNDFYKQCLLIKSMYDNNDNSGVHLGVEGANKIKDKMSEFFQAPNELLNFQQTPAVPKRNRSDLTVTPSLVYRKSKQSKVSSPNVN